MIVAVTGGTGFIGKKLVDRLLARGDTVRLLTRSPESPVYHPQLQPVRCDLATMQASAIAPLLDGVQVLFHCAAQLGDENLMRALHVEGTRKLGEAAAGRISHWVQLSSVGVYGPVRAGEVSEDSALNPVGEYEVTKAESDRIAIASAERGGYSYCILRPSNVFGSEMSNRSLCGLISQVDRGLFFFIGKPGASANYIHVDNVVEAMLLCATSFAARGRTYNLSDYCTMEQMVDTVAIALGKSSPRLHVPKAIASLVAETLGRMPGFPLTPSRVDALTLRTRYSSARIGQELGYCHAVKMEDGLRELVRACRR